MSIEQISRKRIFSTNKCKDPILYVYNSNTPANSVLIIDGKYFNYSTMYFFATCETSNAILNWTIKIYNSGGTLQNTYTGTKSISALKTIFGSTSGYSIPTSGYAVLTVYCTCTGYRNSDTKTYRVNRTKQQLVVTATAAGTYHYHAEAYAWVQPDSAWWGSGLSTVRYTTATSGTPATPTASSSEYVYGTSIPIERDVSISYKAFTNTTDFTNSSVLTCCYKLDTPALNAPNISPAGGTFNTVVEVTISRNNNVGEIYYTKDGTTPTASSLQYTGKFVLTNTTTVKAVVIEPYTNTTSPVNSKTFTIDTTPVLTGEIKSITADSMLLTGTITYNKWAYYVPSDYGSDGLTPIAYTHRPIVGFQIRKLDTTDWQHVWCYNTDLTGNENGSTNDDVRTIKFKYALTNLPADTSYDIAAEAYLYHATGEQYQVGNTYPPHFYDYTQKQHLLAGMSYNPTTLSGSRGKYTVDTSVNGWNGCCDYYDTGHYHHNVGQTVKPARNFNIQVLLSVANLSFSTNTSNPMDYKKWGGNSFKETRSWMQNYMGEPICWKNEYRTRLHYVEEPWDYIGDSSYTSTIHSTKYGNTNSDMASVRDLFGWGASFNNRNPHQTAWEPWSTSTTDSHYWAYNSSTMDLRNVRSNFLQAIPAEPNYPDPADPFSENNPHVWADFGTMFSNTYCMWGLIIEDPYSYCLWNDINQGTQGTLVHVAERATTMINSDNITTPNNGFYNGYQAKLCTLSAAEWTYLLFTRTGNRFAKGRIRLNNDTYNHNNTYVNGLFIFSDTWTSSNTTTFNNINETNAPFTANTISEDTWNDTTKQFENSMTFLPAAGYRTGTAYSGGNSEGYYWTRTHYDNTRAKALHFNASTVEIANVRRSRGCSVRLARYVYTQI